jgi:Tfp pilus assembly protein PilN
MLDEMKQNRIKLSKTAQQLFWFVALWAVGVLAVGIVAYGIRLLIK